MSPMLNLHHFLPRSQANGPGERAVVWVQGCPRRCAGCFNPDSLPFVTKKLVSVDDLAARIAQLHGIIGITFSGGEPFAQAEALAELGQTVRERGLTVVCYTGYTLLQLRTKGTDPSWKKLLDQVDLLIDGPFVESLRCFEPFRGSSNQELYYLSGRIRPDEVEGQRQKFEVSLDASGELTTTGFPPALNVGEILRYFDGMIHNTPSNERGCSR